MTTAVGTDHAAPDPERERLRDVPAFVWLLLAAFVANVFSGNTQYLGLPIGPDRLLFPAAIALVLLDPHRARLRPRGVYLLMGALCLWTAWSALAHGTLLQPYGLFALLDRVALPFMLFAIAPLVFATPRRRDLFLQTLVVIGLYLGATAVFEIVGPRSLVLPRFILDPTLGIHAERARGPFLSGEANGMALDIAVFAAVALMARRSGLWRMLAALTVLFGTIGCVLTMTRSVWLALALGAVAAAVVVPRLRAWVAGAVAAGVAAVATVLIAVPGLGTDLLERLMTQGSLDDRHNTNAAALRIIEQRPLDGIGWMTFESNAYQWVRQADLYPVTTINIEVHNVFLARAAELGVVASLAYGLCVVLGPVAVFVRARTPGDLAAWRILLLACSFVWLIPTLMSPNPYPFPNLVLWTIAGIAGRCHLTTDPSCPDGTDGTDDRTPGALHTTPAAGQLPGAP